MTLTSGSAKHRRRLVIVLAITGTYLVIEVIGGIVTGSLALIADAGHMLTDVFGLSLSLFAIWFASRPASPQRTYGYYRSEILAALANAIVLFLISGYILFEAWRRFQSPPEIESGPMLAVAVVGLIVNIIGVAMLRGGAGESINVEGAYLEVVSDMLGSIGVIIAALIIAFTGWVYADPIVSVAIGLFIIPRTWGLLREAVGVLIEGTPSHISLAEVEQVIREQPGVASVHDLHAWSITTGLDAMSGHVVLANGANGHEVLQNVGALLRERFKLAHTTIQIETTDLVADEPKVF